MSIEEWNKELDADRDAPRLQAEKAEARVAELEATIRGALRSRDRREPVDFEALEAALSPSSPSSNDQETKR